MGNTPDYAVMHQGARRVTSLKFEGFSVACHVKVQIKQDAAAAQAEGRAIPSVVHFRLSQMASAPDEHPLLDLDTIPACIIFLTRSALETLSCYSR